MATEKKVRFKKTKKPLACGCLEAAQDAAKKHGFKFSTAIAIDFKKGIGRVDGPFLKIEWLNGGRTSKKLPTMCCSYCPFCGKKK